MKPSRKIIAGVVVVALIGLAATGLALRQRGDEKTLSGYIEGETLYLSAPIAGAVAKVEVRRGQRVVAGQSLFAIEPDQLAAQQARAAADVEASQALAADARKGQRPAELAVFVAEEAAARAAARATQAEYSRTATLAAKGIYAPARLDQASADRDAADARVRAAAQRLTAARLGNRTDQVAAADARVAQSRALLSEASARLRDLSGAAPAAGRIEDVYFQAGEWAAANQPVAALIPDGRVFIRFFAPERQVARYQVGRTVRYDCDGCRPGMTAKIAFVSPRAEFTPPVIDSRESRDRLVFLVEAVPDEPEGLMPGLPVDVAPLEVPNGTPR